MKFGRVLIFSYLSVNKWIIYCEKSVLSVLIPEFNGNIPLQMSNSMKKKLYMRIYNEKYITMMDVYKILKSKFKI